MCLKVAGPVEVRFVLDADEAIEPRLWIPTDLPDGRVPVAALALEKADVDGPVDDPLTCLWPSIGKTLADTFGTPGTDGCLDCCRWNRLFGDGGPPIERGAGLDRHDIDDPATVDVAAELAGEQTLLVFDGSTQCQLEGVLPHALDSGGDAQKRPARGARFPALAGRVLTILVQSAAMSLLVIELIETTLESFQADVVAALPRLLSGLVFVSLAYVVITIVTRLLRSVLERVYPANEQLIVDFFVLVVGVFMWFGAGLVLLNVVGLGAVAASLGTAAGFIGLGVSYALSNMIEDTVAGVYLLRDPDFNEGDSVRTASMTGTVTDIGLRKSRFRTGEGIEVIANRNVEARWTHLTDGGDA